ncbi:MAG TPA: VIT1/CCC1 transporter family protein [Pyrinomonadaceae bacterium]|jgi:VIT1/CCC1 family predicted Fe2+/Mn2+ transporter|nr:VIT1/CCC1 transporter family protein [Pyrinomonadaceae bacterium]
MEHEHTAEAIGERLAAGPRQNYLRDWIYGGIDGSVTTFAVVTGVVGAHLSPVVIVIMGFANLLADGFSMAASNFLGTKSEHDDMRRVAAIEYRHIDVAPEGEREEVRQIFAAKGFEGVDLERVVELITSDRDRWVRTMLTEEYGLPLEARSPWLAALTTFSAFAVCGLVPLVPFLVTVRNAFTISIILTGAVFFVIGSIKSRWSTVPWWRSGLSTFFVGGIAAALAYAVGVVLRRLAG